MKYEIDKLNLGCVFNNTNGWNMIIVILDSNNNIVYQTISVDKITLEEVLEKFYKTTTNIRHKYRDMTLNELMLSLDVKYILIS